MDNTTDKSNNDSNGVKEWISAHPIETMSVVLIGSTIVTYEVCKHLLSEAIFEANKKTIKFMSCDHNIAF